eukprot:Em0003g1465a
MPEQKSSGSKRPSVVEVSVSKCDIHSVVVYRDRGRVQKESIGVEGEGAAKITDVIFNTAEVTKVIEDIPQDGSTKMEFEKMTAEIQELQKEMKLLQLKEEVFQNEKSFLRTYAGHISKAQTLKDESPLSQLFNRDTVKMVMEFYECYEKRISDLDQSILGIHDSIKKLNEKVMVLRANAAKLDPNARALKTTKETVRSVHVGLDAAMETDVTIFVSYVVSNASWSPSYDVRVLPAEDLMRVQYFGHIKQWTGEDWLNAKISLSTAQPSLGGTPPTLGQHTIKFSAPTYSHLTRNMDETESHHFSSMTRCASVASFPKSYNRERRLSIRKSYGKDGDDDVSDHEAAVVEVETAEVSTGMFNTTYTISSVCNIPSDSAEHKVTVTFIDLKANLSYVAVPGLSPYCFLRANLNNTSLFTILAGPANIFIVNNFIAKSKFLDESPNEYFTLHLGVDQSIRITSHPIAITRGNTRSLTRQSNQTITSVHIINVKNTKTSEAVSVELTDQLPLSTDERIKVTLVEPNLKRRTIPHGYVVLKPNVNNLEYHLDLPADTEVSLKVEYVVEYPPNFFVEGLPK